MSLIHQMLENMQERRSSTANVLNYLRATGMDIPGETTPQPPQPIKPVLVKSGRSNLWRTAAIALGGIIILLVAKVFVFPDPPVSSIKPTVGIPTVAQPVAPPTVQEVKVVTPPPLVAPVPPPPQVEKQPEKPFAVEPEKITKKVVTDTPSQTVPPAKPAEKKAMESVREYPPPEESKPLKPPPRQEPPEGIRHRAEKALQEDNVPGARKVLAKGLKQFPQAETLILLQARLALQENDYSKATALLERVVANQENRVELYSYQAMLQQKTGHFAKAAEYYQQLILTEPERGNWWLGLAICLERVQKITPAKDAYYRATQDVNLPMATRLFADEQLNRLSGK